MKYGTVRATLEVHYSSLLRAVATNKSIAIRLQRSGAIAEAAHHYRRARHYLNLVTETRRMIEGRP